VNPVRRKQPFQLIPTGIAGIDLNNTLVAGQKIPFFANSDQPYNEVMATVALRAAADKIILGGMGLTNCSHLFILSYFRIKLTAVSTINLINLHKPITSLFVSFC